MGKTAEKKSSDSGESNVSRYGSDPKTVRHEVGEVEVDGEVHHDVVVCEDDAGFYTTKMSWVRGNLLDPYRCYRRTALGDAKIIMAAVEAEEDVGEALEQALDGKEAPTEPEESK